MRRATQESFLGLWEIESTDSWDADYLALVGEPVIRFGDQDLGELHLGAIDAWLDYRVIEDGRGLVIEWTWEGEDDGTAVSGRGWAKVDNGRLVGHLYIHNGDDSGFVAFRR
jgi:hypothetical protein